MLVLSIPKGKSITVDGPAKITFLRPSGGRILLGIDAPFTTRILREGIKPFDPVDKSEDNRSTAT